VMFMSVRYDREGFAGVEFHDSVERCLSAALEDGCLFASIGEHPKAEHTRHFAHGNNGWRELKSGEELDRLRGLVDPPMLFWRAA
jgi:hypothetical protein